MDNVILILIWVFGITLVLSIGCLIALIAQFIDWINDPEDDEGWRK